MNNKRLIISFYSFGLFLILWFSLLLLEIDSLRRWLHFGPLDLLWSGILILINTSYLFILPLAGLILVNSLIKKITKQKIISLLIALIFTFFYQLAIFLIIYHLREGYIFDWRLLWFYRTDALITLFKIFDLASWLFFILLPLAVLIIFILNIFSLKNFISKIKSKTVLYLIIIFILLINLISLTLSPWEQKGEINSFLTTILAPSQKVKILYQNYYYEHLNQLRNNKLDLSQVETKNLLGDKIFFIHLESVNGFLINPKITPQLFKYSKKGIFFPQIYNNSAQTIRAEENILCGLPPTLNNTLINSLAIEKIKELNCLPSILKSLGYKTLFFKNDDPKFFNGHKFMPAIGFEEIHYQDIMQPGDPKIPWGFREDIFYQRVFEYLEANYPDEKIFAYIAVSATNHCPFTVYDPDYQTLVPYPQPKKFAELLANTTFIQDAYVGKLLAEIAPNYYSNPSFFIFGDHAWPAGIHPQNISISAQSYEENFLTTLLFIPPTNQKSLFQINKTVATRYSQMDILPTILDLLNIKNNLLLGNSWAAEILKNNQPEIDKKNNIVTIQPHDGSYINVIDYPTKYLFDVRKNQVRLFNLEHDPEEIRPAIFDNPQNYFYLLADFFNYQK